jgi:YjbE family integral membrane protein
MQVGLLAAIGGIALVDIVLSGDNALVIGAAAGKLPRSQRMVAVFWGGIAAIVLRLVMAIAATKLLQVPLLQAIGGVVLFGIAVKLLLPEREAQPGHKTADRLSSAIITILVADVTMSLDNVIAVAGLAAGNVLVLAGGVLLSMILLFVASTIIARLMDYFSWLLDLAAVVLAWTAATLVLGDPIVSGGLSGQDRVQTAIHFFVVALILLVDLFLRAVRTRKAVLRAVEAQTAGDPHDETVPPATTTTSTTREPSEEIESAPAGTSSPGNE